MSIMKHLFSFFFQTTISGLLCGTVGTVLINVSHHISISWLAHTGRGRTYWWSFRLWEIMALYNTLATSLWRTGKYRLAERWLHEDKRWNISSVWLWQYRHFLSYGGLSHCSRLAINALVLISCFWIALIKPSVWDIVPGHFSQLRVSCSRVSTQFPTQNSLRFSGFPGSISTKFPEVFYIQSLFLQIIFLSLSGNNSKRSPFNKFS